MARKPRLDGPGTDHHVWVRGVARRPIFIDESDRLDLRSLIEEHLLEGAARALVWVFMTNHVHLVIRTGDTPLSAIMRIVLYRHAREFNRRNDGSGHVFQGRFGSRRLDGDSDLLGVARYVLRNPLEAGLVSDITSLERYPWSACGALLGHRRPFAFEDPEALLVHLGDRSALNLRRWLMEESASERRASLLSRLIDEVCRESQVSPSELLTGFRSPTISRARTIICKRAVFDLGMAKAEVARQLRISRAAVTIALRRC